MPTPMQIKSANSIYREFVRVGVDGRRYDAQAALNDITRALNTLRENGADRNYLQDTLAGLLDVASGINAGLERDLDGAGAWEQQRLDVSEVQALLERVS